MLESVNRMGSYYGEATLTRHHPLVSYPWYVADWRNSEARVRLSLAERGLFRECSTNVTWRARFQITPECLREFADAR
jgi:hypothetical protein